MEKLKSRISNTPAVRFLIFLVVTNAFFVALAGLFYSGKYLFWEYPLSFLGSNYTYIEKIANIPSTYFYSLGMLISGVTVLALALHDRLNNLKDSNSLRLTLYIFMALGFLITAFSPDDTAHVPHVLGSIILGSTVWLLVTIKLCDAKEQLTRARFLLFQLVFQVPFFLYASMYFLNVEPLASSAQKLAIFSLCAVLIYLGLRQGESSGPKESSQS